MTLMVVALSSRVYASIGCAPKPEGQQYEKQDMNNFPLESFSTDIDAYKSSLRKRVIVLHYVIAAQNGELLLRNLLACPQHPQVDSVLRSLVDSTINT